MHGEYKMPGGKLIVADLETDKGHLSRVQISGDFFLEPDSALDAINQALEGLPVDADESAIALHLDAALDDGVRMFGISSQAIAVAVIRARENPA